MRIKLYNRDGASMYLYRNDESIPIEPNIYEWEITVDSKHKYILEYCRVIYEKGFDSNIVAIDPSGGPFISLGDEFEFLGLNEEKEVIKMLGKIVKINSAKSIWISENNNS